MQLSGAEPNFSTPSGVHGKDNRFSVVLIKPSHYDDEGYVIQWFRSAVPSNSLAVMHGLTLDARARAILGPEIDIDVQSVDEDNTRIRTRRLIKQLKGQRGIVILVGVQSNQFPRAMDIARPLRVAGIPVCLGGFHVSGSISMLGGVTPELQSAMDLGISLFAGEAEEGRLDLVLHDAWHNRLKPLYNYLNDLPSLEGAPAPMLPAATIRGTIGKYTSFDAGRGCPFQCSFCTIINVQGRKSRRRTVEEVEQIVRNNLKQGVARFFITDDNFARNTDWEKIFDRLIEMREQENLNIKFMIQVDTMCHRLPHFIEKAGRAGVRRVFIGLESINPVSLASAHKKQNKISEYRKMLLAWKQAGAIVFAGYIIGFPGETPESVLHDIRVIQKELAIDLLEPHCLTALPGSADHQQLHAAGAYLDPDLNKYDLEHVTTTHSTMSTDQWEKLYRDTWKEFYTPEHMETVIRRAVATGISSSNMMVLLLWFHFCIVYEKIDPLQGGYLRRKYRCDRRPTLPVQSLFSFYPRYVSDLVYKHYRMARLAWRFHNFKERLKREPAAKNYSDLALTADEDTDTSALEMMLTQISVAR
ncbi:radical SAM protein [Granulicella sp. S190]|uniref:B12-binding domain-containing radical SAM protein n=1 Tax=Granulicella sp. S190 TaxID=1747226 RepID=UPI00131BB468|nr:radical SAM protein [Granulicella sp. S190]